MENVLTHLNKELKKGFKLIYKKLEEYDSIEKFKHHTIELVNKYTEVTIIGNQIRLVYGNYLIDGFEIVATFNNKKWDCDIETHTNDFNKNWFYKEELRYTINEFDNALDNFECEAMNSLYNSITSMFGDYIRYKYNDKLREWEQIQKEF